MSRIVIPIVLVLALNLLSIGSVAMAFTLRFGAVPVAEDPTSIHHTAANNIPTPRMLNFTVGAAGATFGPVLIAPNVQPKVTDRAPAANVRNPSRVVDASSTTRTRRPAHPRQLSGVEIMLLRHAQQMAER